MKLNIRVMLVAFGLTIGTVASAVSIWGSSSVTPVSTYRIPVDVSASGGPSQFTVGALDTYLSATTKTLTNKTLTSPVITGVGATTQLIFNDAGTLAGDSGFVFDKTNNTVDLGGGTVAASDPVLDLTQTWNNGAVTFTGFKLDVTAAAKASTSKMFDFQVGGTSVLSLVDIPPTVTNLTGPTAYPLQIIGGGTNLLIGSVAYPDRFGISGGIIAFPNGASILANDGYLQQRNSTIAQSFQVFKTYTDASNYERLALNNPAQGYVQFAAETAGTGTDNINVVVSPAGTGGIMAQVPDSGTAGGNARGIYSTDWGRIRGAATQAATGAYSTLSGGYYNTTSGSESVVGGGSQNTASNTQATVGGGVSNIASGVQSTVFGGNGSSARGTGSIAGGHLADAVNGYDVALGGDRAYASGTYSVAIGGFRAGASGVGSVAIGGPGNVLQNSATAEGAVVIGGDGNTASGIRSWIIGGNGATTRGLKDTYAYSGSSRAAQGDAQVIGQPVRRTTTDATPVSMATDGTAAATTVMVLPAESTNTCWSYVTANHSAAGVVSMAGWKVEAIVKNDSSTITLSGGTCVAIGTPDASLATASCALVANGTLDSVELQVTGVAATTIYWVASPECVQAF